MRDPLRIIDRLFNQKFRVTRYVGEGGFGYVYVAEDKLLNFRGPVALKMPKDESKNDSVFREADALSRLDQSRASRFVLKFYEVLLVDDKATLATEFCLGGSLYSRLRQRTPHTWDYLPVTDALDFCMQTCEALEDAAREGIVHRDVKPQNMFLTEVAPGFGEVRLGDFGIAKIIEESGTIGGWGTPDYVAPEIHRRCTATPQCDLYSLGATLYFLLTGYHPVNPELDELGWLHAKLNGDYRPIPSSVPEHVQAITLKALAPDPAQRYKTATELKFAIEKALLRIKLEEIRIFRDGGGDYAETLRRLAACIKRFPESREPYLLQAEIQCEVGDIAAARSTYSDAIRKVGDDAALLKEVAIFYAGIGPDMIAAVDMMRRALVSKKEPLTGRDREDAMMLLKDWHPEPTPKR